MLLSAGLWPVNAMSILRISVNTGLKKKKEEEVGLQGVKPSYMQCRQPKESSRPCTHRENTVC